MNLHTLPFVINDSNSGSNELSLDENVKVSELDHFPETLIHELKNELDAFSKNNAVLKNILISTADGFEIASLLTPGSELHIRKVSALTSS